MSSTPSPHGGRSVTEMNTIINRELEGAVVDEESLQSTAEQGLVKRLLPPFSISASELNKHHRQYLEEEKKKKKKHRKSKRRCTPEDKSDEPHDLYDVEKEQWKWKECKVHTFNERVEAGYTRRRNDAFINSRRECGEERKGWMRGGNQGEKRGISKASSTDIEYDDDDPNDESYEDEQETKGAKNFGTKKHGTEDCFAAFLNAAGQAIIRYLRFQSRPKKSSQRPHSPPVSPQMLPAESAALSTASVSTCEPPPLKQQLAFRSWLGYYSMKKLPTETDLGQVEQGYNRKPDLILLEHAYQLLDNVTWKSPKAIGELTKTTFRKSRTIQETLNQKAYLLFSSQPWRRYVLGLSFAKNKVRVHLYDRSGSIRSRPYEFDCAYGDVIRILHAFLLADRRCLGFDPTIQITPYRRGHGPNLQQYAGRADGKGPGERFHILRPLWANHGFIGRGTLCYHVRPDGEIRRGGITIANRDYVLKDYWITEDLIDHESGVLKKIQDIPGVPQLVDSCTVEYEGKPDSTDLNRPKFSASFPRPPKLITRFHRRHLLYPLGVPITEFKSQHELISGLIDIVKVHDLLVKHGIFHRNISPNNLIFCCNMNKFISRAMIIDFDYTVYMAASGMYGPKGMGTLPFVSLAILSQLMEKMNNKQELVNVSSGPLYDLEALFYVFIWICIKYNGPNGRKHLKEKVVPILHAWSEGGMSFQGLFNAHNSKFAFIAKPLSSRQFSPYFANLAPLAEEWCTILRDQLLDENPSEPHVSHAIIINMLENFLQKLPVKDPPTIHLVGVFPEIINARASTVPAVPAVVESLHVELITAFNGTHGETV
ncbi:hypothetical protein BV22DRAFT_1134544 [Leucogyrophana mollusca]|uniref:Uncharacterized protein n=1 Tax=Leucogyrophana mollusca TaxID=85980 RepID=A0ACB8AZU0_9AGAM|nr:hypothetical protein BV22DRAFT_1134544 [Leucogyrophana mollusca]